MKVKYTSSKWFLENNGKWIDIEQKDWEKVDKLIWERHAEDHNIWNPDPLHIYSLPDEVEFEIKDVPDYACQDPRKSGYKKVAHLKVDQKLGYLEVS